MSEEVKTCVGLICDLIFGLGTTITVLVLAVIISKKKPELYFTEELHKDVNLSPLYDFKIVESNAACDVGLSEISLGKWPGSIDQIEKGKQFFIWKNKKRSNTLLYSA